MKLHELKPNPGSVRKRKRIGRGTGSGKGGTSTRGHKGAKSRSGYSQKRGFEGGQMPLQRRVPKFGFNNINRIEYKPINLDTLEEMAKQFNVTAIDTEFLLKHGFSAKKDRIKVLGRGEITAKLEVKAHKFSQSAKDAIEKAGGSVTVL
jgi:large subunit ribosomal protein L15